MKKSIMASRPGQSLKKLALLAIIACSTVSLQAEDVFIPGWKGLAASVSDQVPCPPSCVNTAFPAAGAGNASASLVSPVPIIPNNARRIHYGIATGAVWSLTPTDISVTPAAGGTTYNLTALQNIGVYKIYLTKGQDNNASTNIIIQMSAVGGDLADTNGVGSAAINLDMFQKGKTNHVWVHVGYITNSTLSPTITLAHVDGAINNTDAAGNNAQRWYTDAIRFEFMDQCSGVAPQLSVGGPLVQGQSFVNVTGVVAGATNVAVYANGSIIGETNFASGFAAGSLTVATTRALIKGDSLTAGQIKNGCVSSVPASGPITGSGPNVSLKAFMSFWRDAGFTGPVGANAPTNLLTQPYFLKATGFQASFGTAPVGGELLTPSGCWQTITFNHATDPLLSFNGASSAPNTDAFAALQGLVFTLNENESGPYDVYVDSIMNGDTVIENFEGYAPGTVATFISPNQATAPSQASTYLSAPNSSLVSQNNAFDGTNALRVQWQWLDGDFVRWAHIAANSSGAGKAYPQIDVTKPITVRYLVLPAGQSTAAFKVAPVANQSVAAGATATFNASATGTGPFTYQWRKDGVDLTDGANISGATSQTLSVSAVSSADEGRYSVVVTAGCAIESNFAVLSLGNPPQPSLSVSRSGSTVTISWEATGFVLQEATDVAGTYQTVSGAVSPHNVNAATGTKFYRLQSN